MLLKSKVWYDKVEYYEMDVDPKDFIDCEDEDELWECIKETIETSKPVAEKFYDSDSEFNLPEEFINEWIKYKNDR